MHVKSPWHPHGSAAFTGGGGGAAVAGAGSDWPFLKLIGALLPARMPFFLPLAADFESSGEEDADGAGSGSADGAGGVTAAAGGGGGSAPRATGSSPLNAC